MEAAGDEHEPSTKKEAVHHSVMDQQHHEEDHSAKDETVPPANVPKRKNLYACAIEPGISSTPDFTIYIPPQICIFGFLDHVCFCFDSCGI